MKTSIFNLLALLFILNLSCQQTAEKYTKSVEEKVETFEKSAKDGEWLQKLAATKPYADHELLAKIPNQLVDLPLRGSNIVSPQTVGGTYSTSAETSHETANISVSIVDGAGDYAIGHVNQINRMLLLNVDNNESHAESQGWAKTLDYKGHRILLKEGIDKGVQFSELQYIKDNRYHITLSGRRFDSNQLLQAKDELEKIIF
jgi:hypothetical protein